MLDLLFFSFFGIIIGGLAGLLPGLHPNQIYFFLSSFSLFIEQKHFVVFLCSLAVSNIVFSYLPSLFLSLPEINTVINVLPGHKMVIKGEGKKALLASLTAAVITFLILFIFAPLMMLVLPVIYKATRPFVHLLLVGFVVFMVFLEKDNKKRLLASLLFILSGIWGILTLNNKLINSNESLMPALTGLFGLPALLMTSKSKIPKQNSGEVGVFIGLKAVFLGLLAGILSGILPGAGESQAGLAVMSFQRLKDEEVVGSLSSINAANMFLSLLMLAATGKIRSGLAEFLSSVGFNDFLFLACGSILFSAGISSIMCFWLGNRVIKLLESIDYKKLSYIIISLLVLMVLLLSGPIGLLILLVSTCMGMLPLLVHVKRTSNMGFLIVPTILYYLGWMGYSI
jgi:putative membrane protein